ncbi:MAG: Nucleic acid binding OB-fold tRNA/helicase [Jatrophihabitans sp.]|nr:Nucleic acid binding OB-fold tRNA/helicase [Jatrophihabitans sp.]
MSLLSRLTASPQRLDAAELESEVEQLPCAKLKTVTRGEYAVVGGRLRSVIYTPTANVPVLEAELFDGSAAILLVWLGRRRITGIEPGRRLLAKGRVGMHDGRLAIYNPWYELTCSS